MKNVINDGIMKSALVSDKKVLKTYQNIALSDCIKTPSRVKYLSTRCKGLLFATKPPRQFLESYITYYHLIKVNYDDIGGDFLKICSHTNAVRVLG